MDDKYNGGQNVLNEHEAMDGMHHLRGGVDGSDMLPGLADGGGSLRSSAINAANFQTFNKSMDHSGRMGGGGGRRAPPESYTCNRCGTKGHWIEDCPTKDQQHVAGGPMQRKVPPDGYLCKRCNIPGHYISDCTQPKVPPPSYTCHKCRQKGHWKQDCPMDGNGSVSVLLGQVPRPPMAPISTGGVGPPPPPRALAPPRGFMPPPPPAPSAVNMLVPPPPPPHILAGMKRARGEEGGIGGLPMAMGGWPPMAGGASNGPAPGGIPGAPLGQPNLKKQSRDPRRRQM
ncbi:hypothetical protein BBJ28_00025530 [Nothophytophthora sp. Chile5]|nr:hypothetical protein BBJ28_00025530 [Nothophytophthora sp. Chile5]